MYANQNFTQESIFLWQQHLYRLYKTSLLPLYEFVILNSEYSDEEASSYSTSKAELFNVYR